jgi:hypothetical protein
MNVKVNKLTCGNNESLIQAELEGIDLAFRAEKVAIKIWDLLVTQKLHTDIKVKQTLIS